MSVVQEIWNIASESLRKQMTEDTFQKWIAIIQPVSCEAENIKLGVSNSFFADWIAEHYESYILDALESTTGKSWKVSFEEGHDAPVTKVTYQASKPHPVKAKRQSEALGRHPQINQRLSFSSFVVGNNSKFPYAACKAVASAPGEIYNPLFIHGDTSLGKTHLMNAIAQDILKDEPKTKVALISCEDFLNEYVDAMNPTSSTSPQTFKAKYREVDVLLMDDVHILKGKKGMQEEFFHTFNALFNKQKQIVMTCDRPPHEIEGLDKRLVSRFECGQIVDLAAPEYETRLAILRSKLEGKKVNLSDEVMEFIASHIRSNVRRLEGALTRLTAYVSMMGEEMDVETAERLLGSMLTQESSRKLTVKAIQKSVASYYSVTLEDMMSSKRPQNIAFPRQVAMYLSRSLTGESLPSIGDSFNRNHATIIHAHKTISKKAEQDMSLKQALKQFERQLQVQSH